MRANEVKKSHKRPKFSIKPRNPVLPNMQSTGAGAHTDKKKDAKNGVVKHKKRDYAEHLEQSLENALLERQDMMAGVGMGDYRADEGPKTIKVLRMGDEWQVHIAGKILRIPTDEASDREEAIAIAKTNLGIAEAREISPALLAAQRNLAALKQKQSEKKVAKAPAVVSKSFSRANNVPDVRPSGRSPEPIAKGGQVHDPEMEKMLADFLAKGGEIKKGRPGKAPPIGRNQASQHIGGGGAARPKRDRPGQGANYSGSKIVAVENSTPYMTHDDLAAQLFEQEITYEDQLNGKLKRLLGK